MGNTNDLKDVPAVGFGWLTPYYDIVPAAVPGIVCEGVTGPALEAWPGMLNNAAKKHHTETSAWA